MVNLFGAFFFCVTKTMFQIRRLKHMTNPFSPHHPPQQFTPPTFQEVRGTPIWKFRSRFQKIKIVYRIPNRQE